MRIKNGPLLSCLLETGNHCTGASDVRATKRRSPVRVKVLSDQTNVLALTRCPHRFRRELFRRSFRAVFRDAQLHWEEDSSDEDKSLAATKKRITNEELRKKPTGTGGDRNNTAQLPSSQSSGISVDDVDTPAKKRKVRTKADQLAEIAE